MKHTALNRFAQARKQHQYAMLARSSEDQEEQIAKHYVAFAQIAMQLRELTEERKRNNSPELNELIQYLCKKIREGHLMEFGIELEWPSVEPTGAQTL